MQLIPQLYMDAYNGVFGSNCFYNVYRVFNIFFFYEHSKTKFSFQILNSHFLSLIPFLCSFEILHARWAMLAALGALIPEVLDLSGAFHFIEPVWWRVGYSKLKASILTLSLHQSSRDIRV